MYTDIEAVALRTVRHNDRSSILTAWSPRLGRLSLVMGAGNSAESRRRRALTMPLSLFEAVVNVRGSNELLMARDIKAWHPSGRPVDVASHPVRASVAVFVAEVLGVVTREGDNDPALWSLIVETATVIAEGGNTALANMPAMFLLRLAGVLGIAPETDDWRPGRGLDMAEGVFRSTRPIHDYWIDAESTHTAVVMGKAARGYSHSGSLRLSRKVRSDLLENIIQYFTLHHYPLDRLRSLDVLKALFR